MYLFLKRVWLRAKKYRAHSARTEKKDLACMDLSVYDYAAGQMPISVYILLSEYHYLWTRKPDKPIYTQITDWGIRIEK